MMKRIYLYPMRNEAELEKKSPYIDHLSTAIKQHFKIVNYGRDIKLGILDIGKYINKADIFYFNWIENITGLKIPVFLFFFYLAKLLKKKIVWTHHNVHPHNAKKFFLVNFLIRHADVVIIHTEESYPYLKARGEKKILYFFHPFFSERLWQATTAKEWDILIWGNMRESKGVNDFLHFLRQTKNLYNYKIKIAGKFESELAYQRIKALYENDKIEISNKFLDKKELAELHEKSKYVLFPYTGSSVLNSGALITSIPYRIKIIGPSSGAFKELGKKGFIHTYDTFDNVLDIINSTPSLESSISFESFFKEHSWNKFGLFLKHNL